MATIGILGMGTMGAAVAESFGRAGHRVLTDLTGRSAVSVERAERRGIEVAGTLDQLAAACGIVFSIVPPEVSAAVAERFAEAAVGGTSRPVFVDANAVSPRTMTRLERICGDAELPLIDGGIVGGPPREGYRPRLYLSGPRADILTTLEGQAFDLKPIGVGVGRASAFKMTYAGLTKGLNALLVNQLMAAEGFGFLDAYCEELAFSQADLLDRAERSVPRLPADAGRWIAEMHEIGDAVATLGLTRGFSAGAADVMARLAASPFSGEVRETVDASRSMKDTIRGL